MKINRPNNWTRHQRFAGNVPHYGERGTAYTITPNTADPEEARERLRKLREVVTEVTGIPTKPPVGFL
jgi:hypothetical protein